MGQPNPWTTLGGKGWEGKVGDGRVTLGESSQAREEREWEWRGEVGEKGSPGAYILAFPFGTF